MIHFFDGNTLIGGMIPLSSVISMQDYLANKQFKEQVLPFFHRLHASFTYYQEQFDVALVLNQDIHVVVFIQYIPVNTFTELPTVTDSFHDIQTNPRVSTGEWVVENIFELSIEKSTRLLRQLDSTMQNPVRFLKQQIKK